MLIQGSPAGDTRRAAEPKPKTDPTPAATLTSGDVAPLAGRHLPQMLLATAIVVVLPLAVSLTLRASGLIFSPWLAIGLTVTVRFSTQNDSD